MAWFGAKRPRELEAERDITDDVIESDFVPAACHFNAHTLITKDGELSQTLHVPPLAAENPALFRDHLRKALSRHVKGDGVAMWVHVIRERCDLPLSDAYPDTLSRALHEAGSGLNQARGFCNHIYVTFVHEGQSGRLRGPADFLRGLWPPAEYRYRDAYLEKAEQTLSALSEAVRKELATFGAVRLGVTEKDGVAYSEPCRFLGKLINLTDTPRLLPDADISAYLSTHEVTFGANAMEIRGASGRRRFGALLVFKEYKELPQAALEKLLTLPVECIITQAAYFTAAENVLAEFRAQDEFLRISGDKELAARSGIADMMESDKKRITDYARHQLSFFLQADDLPALERYVAAATNMLNHFGLVVTREDVKLEEGFWAQIPGNFVFLKRLRPINTSRLGGFTHALPGVFGAQKRPGGQEAVTLLKTASRIPFYFHFHEGEAKSGHTLLLGAHAQSIPLAHFLAGESRKFGGKLILFDRHRRGELLLRALGGQYYAFGGAENDAPVLNPLARDIDAKYRRFLSTWLASLIGEAASSELTPSDARAMEQAVEKLETLPAAERTLAILAQNLAAEAPALSAALAPWVEGGHRGIFGGTGERSGEMSAATICGFDLDRPGERDEAHLPVFLYVLQLVMQGLEENGPPSLILFHDAPFWFDNPYMGPHLAAWLEAAQRKNALALMTCEDAGAMLQCAGPEALRAAFPTRLVTPGAIGSAAEMEALGISPELTAQMNEGKHPAARFWQSRQSGFTALEWQMPTAADLRAILEGTPEARARMQELMRRQGTHPAQWLAAFRDSLTGGPKRHAA